MSLQQRFKEEIVPKLRAELGLSNVMAVPKVEKVTVNVGVKEALGDKKVLGGISEQIAIITGQKPVVTKAKKSISAFKLRVGDPIGVMVTLRGKRMYDFLEKIVTVVLPRVRDFHGLSLASFDGKGNYSIGFKEQIAFPEIDAGDVDRIHPLQVVITTSAKDNEQGKTLLSALGMPFRK